MTDILNFDQLLAPIPGENPMGVDLREDISPDSVFQKIKDARQTARAEERRLYSGFMDAKPDWGSVLKLAPAAIAEQSKDLDLATYLLEALVRKHGFAGLRDGLRLIRLLAEADWEHLYPPPDEDGEMGRVAKLAGVIETLIDQAKRIPLTEVGASGMPPFARWQYDRANRAESLTDPKKREEYLKQEDAVTLEMIRQAEAESSPEFYAELLDAISLAIAEQEQLFSLLGERCGKDERGAPNFYAPPEFAESLTLCRNIVEPVARAKMPVEAVEETQPQDGKGDGASQEKKVPGVIQSRNEAFETLLKVAAYFRQAEPQSPVSYALERVVRWGKMPLPDLWSELIEEDKSRTSVFKLVGLSSKEGSNE